MPPYTQPTGNQHTTRYLNAHHHPAQLQCVVKALVTRSQNFSDEEHKPEEMNKLNTFFLQNGFTKSTIQTVSKRKVTTKEDSCHTLKVLSYGSRLYVLTTKNREYVTKT